VDYQAGELIDAEHGYISLAVALHGPFKTAQDRTIDFSDTTPPSMLTRGALHATISV
jgi:hypothetical protein